MPGARSFDEIYSWYGTAGPSFAQAVAHLPFTFFPGAVAFPTTPPRIEVPPARCEKTSPSFILIPAVRGKTGRLKIFRPVAAQLKTSNGAMPGKIDDLYELACWISTARVYIGNDSGISHLAAAVGTPVIAIFVSTDPRLWAPRGEHVVVLENPPSPRFSIACAQHEVLKRR